MANGAAGFSLSADTETEVYECATNNEGVIDVIILARTQSATITVWHLPSGQSVGDAYKIVDGIVLGVTQHGEISKRVFKAGEKLVVKASATGVSVNVAAFEKAAA
jgi:hypothetical protein